MIKENLKAYFEEEKKARLEFLAEQKVVLLKRLSIYFSNEESVDIIDSIMAMHLIELNEYRHEKF